MNGDVVLYDGIVQNVCKQRGVSASYLRQLHLENAKRTRCCYVFERSTANSVIMVKKKGKGLGIDCVGHKRRIGQSVYVVGLKVIGGVYLLLSRSDCSSIGGKGVPVLGTFMVRIRDI